MSFKLLVLAIVVVLAACACSEVTPEQVEVTRIVTAEPIVNQVEVTTIVENEVTRVVEVEVPTTVEIIREVEVTRIQEVVVTATPIDTPTPEPTSPPPQTDVNVPPPSSNVKPELLASMTLVRTQFQEYGGMIDNAMSTGFVSCERVVDFYDSAVASPVYDTSSTDDTVKNANAVYRRAIDIFTNGARDMTQNCRDFLLTGDSGNIPFQQWGYARQQVDEAVNTIHPAILSLGGS